MADSTIEINPQRIQYLLKLFSMSESELLERVSAGLKKPKRHEDIFAREVSLANLKRIDKVFKQGLSFYTDPFNLEPAGLTSVLFRKQQFNAELTHADRLQVDQIEHESNLLDLYAKLSDYPVFRRLADCSTADAPAEAAFEAHKRLHPRKQFKNDRDFLRALINSLGEQDILVLEFIPHPKLNEKPSIEGLFIAPYTIAIRRHPRGYKRQIFTLAHELGHYMLDSEELDQTAFGEHASEVEQWCNKFAFAFLMGPDGMERVSKLNAPELTINSPELVGLAAAKHASRLAIFTHLKIEGAMSPQHYSRLNAGLNSEYEETLAQRKSGNGFGIPKQIREGLEREIYASALSAGTLEEHDITKRFGIKSDDLADFVYG